MKNSFWLDVGLGKRISESIGDHRLLDMDVIEVISVDVNSGEVEFSVL